MYFIPVPDGSGAMLPHLKQRSPFLKRKQRQAAYELPTALKIS